MTNYLQVVTTVDDRNIAEKIAEVVLAKKLAACVQISSCRSIYRWQGKIEKAEEHLCVMKSSRMHYPELEREIREIHPYDVPEILAVEVVAGNRQYLDWLEQELAPIGWDDTTA
jgi:periplasmic divalent cation tolerance protein